MSFFASLFKPATAAEQLSPADFKARHRPGDAVLDVRTPAEYARGHLAGAVNVDLAAPDFSGRMAALGLDPAQPVYLYCRSGNRSGTAARLLRDMGFAEAYNVGGLDALARAGLPLGR